MKQKLKDWEITTGIKIKKIYKKEKGVYNKLIRQKDFLKIAKQNEIVCKTNKGLEFLGGI